MANHRKQPSPLKSISPGSVSSESAKRARLNADLSDLDAPTNAFPIGSGFRARHTPNLQSGYRGNSTPGTSTPGKSTTGKSTPAQIEWHDDEDDVPIDNNIDDLLEDELFEDPPRGVTIPAWALLLWFACAVSLFGLALIALAAALLFA